MNLPLKGERLFSIKKLKHTEQYNQNANSDKATLARKGREDPSVTKRLTKREELSFLMVLALPKASSRGLALMIWSSRAPCKVKSSLHMWGSRFPECPDNLDSYLVDQTHLHFATFLFLLLSSDCNCCKVLDDTLGVHSLPCTIFSTAKQKPEKRLEL